MNLSACPYLGLLDDPETEVAFPSQVNFCHHLKTPEPVSLEYQRTFCQSGRYPQCAAFPQGRHTRLPMEAQAITAGRRAIRPSWILAALITITLFIAGGIALAQKAPGLLPFLFELSPQLGETPLVPTVTAQLPPASPTSTGTSIYFTPTALIPVTVSPSGTIAPDVTLPAATFAPLGLETPIGVKPTLLIHRVLPGENLDLIAARFDTSIEAIQRINHFLPSPLWVDLALVVPLGQSQTEGLPQFESYQVSVSGVTVEQLAQSLDVDVMQLRKYNLLPEGALLAAGQWLLLPRPSK